MDTILENNELRIKISAAGAELTSVFNKQNKQEYLWQADKKWWPRHAPVLFPIVGKLKNDSYSINGNSYTLPQHGFARDKNFQLHEKQNNAVTYILKDDESTLQIYPYHFSLKIIYTLSGKKLTIGYEVKNTGKQQMYFSIGAHPGFICPMQEDEKFTDYYLEFEKAETLDRHLLENGLFKGVTESIFSNDDILKLNYDLFAKDAIVLKNLQSKYLYLKSNKSGYSLKFDFAGFPYLGIWTKPGAPFLCIEPWFGIADYKNSDGELAQKEGIISLIANEVFSASYSIEI